MQNHLWEMGTAWFQPQPNEFMAQTFYYKSWKDFKEYRPYQIWKPYILSSWCWKSNKLQLVFISPERFIGMNRVEIDVKEEDEPFVREWIKNHMPNFWKL
jgi:hypothetical protein